MKRRRNNKQTPKKKLKVEEKEEEEVTSEPEENDEEDSKSLQRTNTIEIIEEESPLQKVNTLIRTKSSISERLLGAGSEGIISQLSAKSQSILQKKLSQILILPEVEEEEEIITFTPFSRPDNEGEYEKMLCYEEEEDDTSLASLPSEIIVSIYELLNDIERWHLAITSKRFLSIFKLYVGWKHITLIQSNNLAMAKHFSEKSEEEGLTFDEIHFVQPFNIRRNREYTPPGQTPRPTFESNSSMITFDIRHAKYKRYHQPPNEYDRDAAFLIVDSHSKPQKDTTKILTHNRTSTIDLSKKKVVGCIPISPISANQKFLNDFDKPEFLSLFLGKESSILTKTGDVIQGRNHLDHFVSVEARVHESEAQLKIGFDIRRYGRVMESPSYQCCKLLKWIVLKIIHTDVIRKSRLIKWSKPYNSTMAIQPAQQPGNLSINLYDYQLCGLAWMKEVEEKIYKRKYRFCALFPGPGYPTCDFFLNSGPFDFNNPDNFEVIRETDNIDYDTRPDLYDTFSTRGAVLGDEMGLGKTVTMISLILSNPRVKNEEGEYFIHKDDPRLSAVFEIKATLIICPSQLVEQWYNEFKAHSKVPLKIHKIAVIGTLRVLTYEDIISSDVVIISHQFLKNQSYLKLCGSMPTLLTRSQKLIGNIKKTKKTPLLQHFGWHRIILDEGHEILSSSEPPKAEGKDLFGSFLSNYRWYVTGTPVPRGRDSLVGALNFLDIKLKSGFKLEEEMDKEMILFEMNLFDAAKKSLFWRNTKESVVKQATIPPTIEEVVYIHLSPIENAIYEAAKVANDMKSMRLVCSQPKNTPFMENIFGNDPFSYPLDISLADRIVKYFRSRIIEYCRTLNSTHESITKYKSTLRDRQLKVQDHELMKPTQIDTEDYTDWLTERTKLKKMVENSEISIKSANERVDKMEEAIVDAVAQAACFTKVLDKDVKDAIQLDKCDYCFSLSSKFYNAEVCHHLFCLPCFNKKLKSKLTDRTKFNPAHFNFNCIVCGTNNRSVLLITTPQNLTREMGEEMDEEMGEEKLINSPKQREDEKGVFNTSKYMPPTINISVNNNDNQNEGGELDPKQRIYRNVAKEHGSKLAWLIDWTYKLLDKDETTKVIVFSKFDDLLMTFSDTLEQYYNNNKDNSNDKTGENIVIIPQKKKKVCVYCKGNVTIRKRVIEQFNSSDKESPRVLLLSLANSASGTHLTVASHIILADSVAGSKEEVKAADGQAIARAHRIGQDKKVKVVRFIVADSLEHQDYLKVYGSY